MSKTRTMDFQLDLGISQPFEIVTCRVAEAISEPTQVEIEVSSKDDLNLETVLAGDATLELLIDGFVERRWSLKVGSARFLTAKDDSLRFAVELHSPEWLLRFTRDTRKYKKLSAQDIVTAVLTRSQVAHRWKTVRKPPRRNYCVQYRETNFDFVRRLLEFEGIHYSFDDDGTMVLADRSGASTRVDGPSHFELLEGAGALSDSEEGVHEVRRGARVKPGKSTVHDFDWKKPGTNLNHSHAADKDASLEFYEYPSGFRNAADGAYLAQVRLEAHRVSARYLLGQASVSRFAPARSFTFGAAAGTAFAGEYLLTRVEHVYHNPSHTSGTTPSPDHIYRNNFEAIPLDVPFRPAVTTPRPNVDGYHTAMVRGPAGEEIHTDKYGRFRAQFHWDREAVGTDDDSRWLRIVQESASSMFLARVGWEMNVAYIDGDPDRPIGLSRNINRVMPPAYGLPAKKTVMTIKTPTSPATGGFNEIRLDDAADAMEFYVRAERDLLNIVKNDRTEAVTLNETRFVGGVLQETVDRDQAIQIGVNSSTEAANMHELQVLGNRVDKVGGNESIKVAASSTVTVKGDDKESVGAVRLTIAGSVSLPNPVTRAKQMAKSMVPTPQAALDKVADGAASGGIAGAGAALKGMIPAPPTGAQVASQLTGGLSEGVTMDKLVDLATSGAINRSGKKQITRMVGGAHVAAAKGSISTSANYGFTEIIGGAKITIAQNGTIAQSISGPLATTVGGAIMRTSKQDMSYSAENSFINVGATARLVSDEKLKIESDDTIEISADTEIKLTVGKVSIKLTPSEIAFTGDLTFKAKEKVAITGKPDNVTK